MNYREMTAEQLISEAERLTSESQHAQAEANMLRQLAQLRQAESQLLPQLPNNQSISQSADKQMTTASCRPDCKVCANPHDMEMTATDILGHQPFAQ
jgi:hypothetical protein